MCRALPIRRRVVAGLDTATELTLNARAPRKPSRSPGTSAGTSSCSAPHRSAAFCAPSRERRDAEIPARGDIGRRRNRIGLDVAIHAYGDPREREGRMSRAKPRDARVRVRCACESRHSCREGELRERRSVRTRQRCNADAIRKRKPATDGEGRQQLPGGFAISARMTPLASHAETHVDRCQ